jgi:hypothetical protein
VEIKVTPLRRISRGRGAATLRAVTTDFQTSDHDVELAIALDLPFQPVE